MRCPQCGNPETGGSDAKAHDDLDHSGTLAGSHGLAGQCAKPAAWRRPNPCTKKRNLDRHAGRMLRGDRLLRLRPRLDQCLRSPLLSVCSLLAVVMNTIRGRLSNGSIDLLPRSIAGGCRRERYRRFIASPPPGSRAKYHQRSQKPRTQPSAAIFGRDRRLLYKSTT